MQGAKEKPRMHLTRLIKGYLVASTKLSLKVHPNSRYMPWVEMLLMRVKAFCGGVHGFPRFGWSMNIEV